MPSEARFEYLKSNSAIAVQVFAAMLRRTGHAPAEDLPAGSPAASLVILTMAATALVRLVVPRRRNMLFTWTLTVPPAICSALAISLFDLPFAMSSMTALWRGDKLPTFG